MIDYAGPFLKQLGQVEERLPDGRTLTALHSGRDETVQTGQKSSADRADHKHIQQAGDDFDPQCSAHQKPPPIARIIKIVTAAAEITRHGFMRTSSPNHCVIYQLAR